MGTEAQGPPGVLRAASKATGELGVRETVPPEDGKRAVRSGLKGKGNMCSRAGGRGKPESGWVLERFQGRGMTGVAKNLTQALPCSPPSAELLASEFLSFC